MGKKTKVGLAVAAAGAAAWAGSKALVQPEPRPAKKAISYERPVVLAHRGGMALAPEHTMAAFRKAAKFGVDGFETDIRLTQDEEIIVLHDEYVDRTSDGAGRVADMTLEELRQLDFGYQFTDIDGEYSYRGKGEKVVTLTELLREFPELLVNIDIKDAPETYEGSLMPSKLWRLLEAEGALDRVVITSFFDEQIDRFNLYAQNRTAIGAGVDEIKKAYYAFTSQFGHLYSPRADVFQIPVRHKFARLDLHRFIAFLRERNVPIHYWVIDSKDEMKVLLASGAKGIVTDRPDIAVDAVATHIAQQEK